MIIKINMQSEVPIYLQLRNEIVKGIGRGEFEPGGIASDRPPDGNRSRYQHHDRQQSLPAFENRRLPRDRPA